MLLLQLKYKQQVEFKNQYYLILGKQHLLIQHGKELKNLQILPHILKGAKVADIMAILGSIDVIMGSVDR